MRLSFLLSAAVPLIIFATELNSLEEIRSAKPMRATVRHVEAGGIGYQTGYTSLDLFLGHEKERYLPFLDLRGHYFNNGQWAANGGIGVRFAPDSHQTVYGFNLYYDYRRSYKTNFQQVATGFEFLKEGWEARINGYLPFWKKSSPYSDAHFGYFKGNHIYLEAKKHVAMAGGDGEIGYNFGPNQKNWSLFIGAGPYFYHPPCGKNAIGGRVRVSAKWSDYLSFNVTETYDNVFNNNVQGEVAINIPFGPNRVSSTRPFVRERIVQPVVRNEIIPLSKCTENPIAIDPGTGNPYFVLFVDNTSSSSGTFEDPFHSFEQVMSVYAPNDIIYVFPGNGLTTGMDGGITLLDNQQLLGSSTAHPINTQLGILLIPAQTGGFRPIISNTTSSVVSIGNNNTVSGFYIQFLNGPGITNGSEARTNLIVSDNLFDGDTSFTAIDLTLSNLSGALTVANNQFNVENIALAVTLNDMDGGTYSFLNNYVENFSLTESSVVLNYINCSGINTNINNNSLFSWSGTNNPLLLEANNGSAPQQPHQYSINHNYISTISLTTVGITNTNYAKSIVEFNRNQIQVNVGVSGGGLDVTSSGQATLDLTMSLNNSMTNSPFLSLNATSTGRTQLNVNRNYLYGGGISFSTTNGTFGVEIEENTIISSGISTLINYDGDATGTLAVTRNNLSSTTNDGINIESKNIAGNLTSCTITNNYISARGASLSLILLDSDTTPTKINNNTLYSTSLDAFGGDCGIRINSSGNTPISILRNDIVSRLAGISINFLDSSVTSRSVSITSNTISAGTNALNVDANLQINGDLQMLITKNTIEADVLGMNLNTIRGTVNSIIEDNSVTSTEGGIGAIYDQNSTGTISVTRNNVYSIGSYGIDIEATSNMSNLTSCNVSNNNLTALSTPLIVSLSLMDTATVDVHNNIVNFVGEVPANGVQIVTFGNTPISVVGNEITNAGQHGIFIGMPSSPTIVPHSLSVLSNRVSCSGNCLEIFTESSTNWEIDVVASNNDFKSQANKAIRSIIGDNTRLNFTISNNELVSALYGLELQCIYTTPSVSCQPTIDNNHFVSGAPQIYTYFENVNLELAVRDNICEPRSVDPSNTNNLYIDSYFGLTSTVQIENNQFHGAKDQVRFYANGSQVINGVVSNNQFGLTPSGSALFVRGDADTTSIWTAEGNTFESWNGQAVLFETLTNANMCVTFRDNVAQPIPAAYFFTNSGAGSFVLPVEPNNLNTGETTATGTTVAPCPF